jgi:Flp pilus assembly protein TadG
MKRIEPVKRRYEAGQAITEFALVATVFLLSIFGIYFMGTLVFAYNSISSAAREAARSALVHGSTTASESAIQTVAINAAPSLGLTTSDVTVTFPADLKVPSLLDAKIVINYPYTIKVPFMKSKSLTLTATAQVPVSQ